MVGNIDRFGRVVIPKAFRDLLKLEAGAEVEIVLDKGAIHIQPRQFRAPMERAADGKLVLTTGPVAANDVRADRNQVLRGVQ